jgi:hypothetical protein
MIINIRGTNGSGKTTVIRRLMDHYGQTAVRVRAGEIVAHRLGCGAMVVGRYVSKADPSTLTPTGGCDTITTQDEVCDAVRRFSKRGSVLFEGLLISGLWFRYDALARELAIRDYRWVFLNTSLEECIARTLARRQKAGNTKPFDPEKSLVGKFYSVQRCHEKAADAGHQTWLFSSNEATEVIKGWLACT